MRVPEAMNEIMLRTQKIAQVLSTLASAQRIAKINKVDLNTVHAPVQQVAQDPFYEVMLPYRNVALQLGLLCANELGFIETNEMRRKLGEWKYLFSHDMFMKTHIDPTEPGSLDAVTARIPLERVIKLNIDNHGDLPERMVKVLDIFIKEHIT